MVVRLLRWLITPQRRPLAQIRADARADMAEVTGPELGMEALDMELVRRTERQNQALERTNSTRISKQRGEGHSFLNVANRATPEEYQDKGYAQKFYAQFLNDKERQNDR